MNGNQLWGSGQGKTQGTQAQPYKLGTLQESALPHLLYSLPYSPIAASLIQDQCHLPGSIDVEEGGTVVPVPKKKYKGICVVENFRGIAVVSVVYKLMCSVVQGRLVQMVEGEHCWLKSKVGSEGGEGAEARF